MCSILSRISHVLTAHEVKNKPSLLESTLKMKNDGTYLLLASLFIPEIFKLLYHANYETCAVVLWTGHGDKSKNGEYLQKYCF